MLLPFFPHRKSIILFKCFCVINISKCGPVLILIEFEWNRNDGEGDGVVGWPPIKVWRKKLCCHGGGLTVENGCSCGGRISKFMYVKVKMEGVAIARKIDLNLYSCFHTLMDTLMDMFGKCKC